jgi:hypothetical protein
MTLSPQLKQFLAAIIGQEKRVEVTLTGAVRLEIERLIRATPTGDTKSAAEADHEN